MAIDANRASAPMRSSFGTTDRCRLPKARRIRRQTRSRRRICASRALRLRWYSSGTMSPRARRSRAVRGPTLLVATPSRRTASRRAPSELRATRRRRGTRSRRSTRRSSSPSPIHSCDPVHGTQHARRPFYRASGNARIRSVEKPYARYARAPMHPAASEPTVRSTERMWEVIRGGASR